MKSLESMRQPWIYARCKGRPSGLWSKVRPTGWDFAHTWPGQLALWTAHSVAPGADTVVFLDGGHALGTEEYWHGVLPHSGILKI